MKTYTLTKEQARKFILLKQGLTGDYKFCGKAGVCSFIKQAGCIQYDPIDVCGKNAELVLQSRVKGFTKDMLYELLYEDRKLVDYFDKNMAIFSIEDWKYFERYREQYRNSSRSSDKVNEVADEVKRIIMEKGYASSGDFDMKDTVDWAWNPTRLSRAALETLYFRGDLIIHHKKGTIKHYGLAEDYINKNILYAEDPNKTGFDFIKWLVARRIGAIGMLWNKPSDAWLGISGLNAGIRSKVFETLLAEGRIMQCTVEGISSSLYVLSEDEELVLTVMSDKKLKKRMEFIAPLDNMMWDRKLIGSIFDFDYKWEIYTPVSQRKYGYYVLPVLYGDGFIGRIEAVADKKANKLIIKNFWKEDEVSFDRKVREALQECIVRFAGFNGCDETILEAFSEMNHYT